MTEYTKIDRYSHSYTAEIIGLERMRSSVNGNPRFRIIFADGTTASTAPDAGVSYGLENRENRNVPVRVSAYVKSGNVWGVKPL